MQMLLEIEDDDEWNDTMEEEDDSDMTSYDVALEALDRIAIALGLFSYYFPRLKKKFACSFFFLFGLVYL